MAAAQRIESSSINGSSIIISENAAKTSISISGSSIAHQQRRHGARSSQQHRVMKIMAKNENQRKQRKAYRQRNGSMAYRQSARNVIGGGMQRGIVAASAAHENEIIMASRNGMAWRQWHQHGVDASKNQ
jgi:hypothetical protein